MRGMFLSAALGLSLIMARAAQAADIAPEPELHGMPMAALAVAGTALTVGVVSLGLWLRKRTLHGKSRA